MDISEVIGQALTVAYKTEDSVSKSCSALCAASLEDFSAVGSSHSFSEAMLLFSLALFGLICSKHIGTSLQFMVKVNFRILYRGQAPLHRQ